MKENSIEKKLENIQFVDLITLLRNFKKEGVQNFIVLRRSNFDEILSDYKRVQKKNEELKEYKKIAELTKISCCIAQNCEALNNAIKEGLKNQKLQKENETLKKEREVKQND